MKDQHVARLEARLEKLVEGAFANLFGKRIRALDIALQLARAMEDNTRHGSNDKRPLAPDQYIIAINNKVRAYLLQNEPDLPQILGEHLVELASNAGYRLQNAPLVQIEADDSLDRSAIRVHANHTNRPENSTAVMERVRVPNNDTIPQNPQLLIDGQQPIPLDKGVINIGRDRDNDVIIDDRYVSRHHIQLRLRASAYILFDVQSQGGTFVNDVRVREHHLQAGDVIRIGKTRLIYAEDDLLDDSGPTQSLDSIQTES